MGASRVDKLRVTSLLFAYVFMIGKTFLLAVDVNCLYSFMITNFTAPNTEGPDNMILYTDTLFKIPKLLLIYGCIHTVLMLVDTVIGLIAVVGVYLKSKQLLETFFITALVTFVLNLVILLVALYRNAQHYDHTAWIITAMEISLHRVLSLLCIIIIIFYYSRVRGEKYQKREAEIIASYVEHVRFK